MISSRNGILYIVATPIGNLGDISGRAIQILNSVDYIAAEDTRHSQHLLRHLGIEKKLTALHDHNERKKALSLLELIKEGASIALISDAGTPLLSDPGYHLVRLAHQEGIQVMPVPGPCSLIAALSAAGLPTDRFVFEGFLPAKAEERKKLLEKLANEERTLVFFEAPHRVLECLEAMQSCFGDAREAVVVRELTKKFETIRKEPLSALTAWIKANPLQQRGEFVLLVGGIPPTSKTLTPEALFVLNCLLTELSVKQASVLAAKITGVNKRALYEAACKKK